LEKSQLKRILADNPIEDWTLEQVVALREDLKPILDLAKLIDQRLNELSADV
jgi:hypothetical protein